MSERTLLESSLRSLNLAHEDSSLLDKAHEILQQVNAKDPHNTFKLGAACKPLICIQLACESLDITFNTKNALKLAQVSRKNYVSLVEALKSKLDMETNLTFEVLGIKFGCQPIVKQAEKMYEDFLENWANSLSAGERENIDWNKNIYKVAIFYSCCRALRIRVSKNDLLSSLNSYSFTPVELNRLIKLVEEHCKSFIEDLSAQKKGSPIKSPSKKNTMTPTRTLQTTPTTPPPTPSPSKEKRKLNISYISNASPTPAHGKKKQKYNDVEIINEDKENGVESIDNYSVNGDMIDPLSTKAQNKDYMDWRQQILDKINSNNGKNPVN
ncbi:2011_t:CDS:2 [Ambispora leptoticha]|uniref:2011_t:CDS:1 n=1 Tax=Ambispora leptoticha TaxID=144679 RepID=A0A9N9A9S1_9GLOM|nr:2011_t:CDS:2 [Ambispora leptoticha]